MKKQNKKVLYDKHTTDGQYDGLYAQLSNQSVSRTVISFTTVYYKKHQLTETHAETRKKDLTIVLDAISKQSLQPADYFELYMHGHELKFDVDYAVTFETTRFYELMTEMSSTYLNAFLNDLNSRDLTLFDKQRLITEHCRDLSYHVAKAIRPTKLPELAWKTAGKDKWQITLGFLLGTLVRRTDDLYDLYITSKDKSIRLDKKRTIQSDDTSRAILQTGIQLMEYELERYRQRMNVTRQAITYVQQNQVEPVPSSTVFRDMDRDNELLILRHKQATMYDSIGRTASDHYKWCIQSKDSDREELRKKLGTSKTFNMIQFGVESDRNKYGTTYGPIIHPVFGVTLADIIPEDTNADEWLVTLNQDDIHVKVKQLHGTLEYVCRQLNPDVTLDDFRLDELSALANDPMGSTAEAKALLYQFTQPLGPMYEALK